MTESGIGEFLSEEALERGDEDVALDACDERVDVASGEGTAEVVNGLTREECRERLENIFKRHAAHREIFYQILVFCQEMRLLPNIEEGIATYPEFKHAAQSPYHFIRTLEEAGGLTRIELDEKEDEVTPERKEGLGEDAIDELVHDYGFETTDAGRETVKAHDPVRRILELLDDLPARKDTYIELMDFCKESPRAYTEVGRFLEGHDALKHVDVASGQVLQPSVFLDKLESAHAIVWDGGWILTEEGRGYLVALESPAA